MHIMSLEAVPYFHFLISCH